MTASLLIKGHVFFACPEKEKGVKPSLYRIESSMASVTISQTSSFNSSNNCPPEFSQRSFMNLAVVCLTPTL